MRVKLKDVTWCLGDTNVKKYKLLWCDQQKRAKRNKPAKINGIQHSEISSDDLSSPSTVVSHSYYQSCH